MSEKGWTEENIPVGDTELVVVKGGRGKPLLCLHGELGFGGWLGWQQALAANRTLWIPLHPGFGHSPETSWIMDVRDLGAFYSRFLREQKLAPIDVIGFSFGGWVAAEMAVANSAQFSKMVLVGATGLRPPSGEIMDMFTVTARTYLNRNSLEANHGGDFARLFGGEQTPAQFEAFENARAATARIAWKPYMFTQSMPHLLENITGLPTLIIWGKQDPVVPPVAGELYNQKIAGSRLVTIDQCGHLPEYEKPHEFVNAVQSFLG